MESPAASVSAIVVTHNSAPELEPLVASLREQPLVKDVVVVDNGSHDNTLKTLEELRIRWPNWMQVVSRGEATGFAKACNLGAQLASGEILLILNPDLELLPGCVDALVERSNQSRDRVVVPLLLNEDRSRQDSIFLLPKRRHLILATKPSAQRPADGDLVEQPAGAALAFPRAVWDRLGGMDEIFPLYYEDVDICGRARMQGVAIEFCEGAVGVHLGGRSSSRSRGTAFALARYGRVVYARKTFGNGTAFATLIGTSLEILVRWVVAVATNRFASPRWFEGAAYARALAAAYRGFTRPLEPWPR